MAITGEYDKMEFLSFGKIIKNECEKENTYKILVNSLDLKGTNTPTMDRFDLGVEIAAVFGSKIKLAAVWPEKDIDRFTETVAVNRGGNIYVAGDMESAKKWLLNDVE